VIRLVLENGAEVASGRDSIDTAIAVESERSLEELNRKADVLFESPFRSAFKQQRVSYAPG
jgi:hypothetical protein